MLNRAHIDDAFRRYASSVRRRALEMLGSPSEAEDIVQDVFLALVDEPTAFEGRSTLLTFLYRMTTTRCLDRIRSRSNRSRLLSIHVDRDATSPPSDAAMWARLTLATVPEDEAAAAIYAYADGMTHEEIARVMGCSRRHVGDLLEKLAARLAARERNDRRAAGA